THYQAKKVYESDDTMIVHINNVPTDYHVIGLFVTEHRDEKILKQEYQRQQKQNGKDVSFTANKVNENNLPTPEQVILVGDYREVEKNKGLKSKSDLDYKVENIRSEMKRISQQITMI